MGFTATRTDRNTWHVLNGDTLEHWESANQAEVEDAIKLYGENAKQREADRLAAEEAARNPQLAEYGTTIPGESAMFEHTVAAAGKANEPTLASTAGTDPAGTTELTTADLEQMLADRKAADEAAATATGRTN